MAVVQCLLGRGNLWWVLGLPLSALAGCAGVTATPLNPDGTAKAGKEGVRYYMPAPYLLVAELPPVNSTSSSPRAPTNPFPGDAGAAAGVAPAPTPDTKKDVKPDASSASSAAPTSDTSFQGNTPQYMIKLVYLPDMSKPMALSAHNGLTGTASMKPTLQDGWMLTSLDASSDSKFSETLSALASLVGSSASLAGTGGASAATMKAPGGPPGTAARQNVADLSPFFVKGKHILKPGLYKFVYDEQGELQDLRPVVFFTGLGTVKALSYAIETRGK